MKEHKECRDITEWKTGIYCPSGQLCGVVKRVRFIYSPDAFSRPHDDTVKHILRKAADGWYCSYIGVESASLTFEERILCWAYYAGIKSMPDEGVTFADKPIDDRMYGLIAFDTGHYEHEESGINALNETAATTKLKETLTKWAIEFRAGLDSIDRGFLAGRLIDVRSAKSINGDRIEFDDEELAVPGRKPIPVISAGWSKIASVDGRLVYLEDRDIRVECYTMRDLDDETTEHAARLLSYGTWI